MLRRSAIWLAVTAAPLAFAFACDGSAPASRGPTTPTSVRPADPVPSTSTSESASSAPSTSAPVVVAPKAPPPACVIKAATWPEGQTAPALDANLAALGTIRVPAGATLTIEAIRTGHQLTFTGPAAFRACTPEEPELVVVAHGVVAVDPAAGAKPDAKVPELQIATPGAVGFAAAVPFKLTVGATTVAQVPKGEVRFGTSENGEKSILGQYTFHRDESAPLVLSRCVVQAASDAGIDRVQRQLAAAGGPPLPSSSVAILGVEAGKHRRLAATDCGVAQARTLLCDVAKADELKEGGDGCGASFDATRLAIAKARRPVELPPGTPFPPGYK